jgi:hypothetical protein
MSLRCLVPPTRTAQERVLSLLRVSVLDTAAMHSTVMQARFLGLLISLLVLGVPVLRDDDNEDDVHEEEGAQED